MALFRRNLNAVQPKETKMGSKIIFEIGSSNLSRAV